MIREKIKKVIKKSILLLSLFGSITLNECAYISSGGGSDGTAPIWVFTN